MKILVLNCGSSSLKYQLIDMDTEQVLAKGLCERIGLNNSRVTHKTFDGNSFEKEISLQNHLDAVQIVMDNLLDENYGVLQNITEIDAVGHRVLHGGKFFNKPVIVDSEVKNAIRECFILGPLHNPQNLMGIEACEKLMPGTKQVAVFDTAFHQTMPTKAFLYALPYEYFERYQIRRYGFHGTSHQYVSMRATKMLDNSNLKIITCHLGNGSSICAVENGKCIDTSMGFTPLEGLAMGTRCGDIDPAIIKFLMCEENLTIDQIDDILNKKSGVFGISGISSDFRDIEAAAINGNERAKIALEIFYYRCAKYIGSYAAAMNGVDAIVFTAGLGENSPITREKICSYLNYLGVEIDKEKNNCRGREINFSADNSRVKLLVVPTNEELMIAKETVALI